MPVGNFQLVNDAKERIFDSTEDLDTGGDAFVATLHTSSYVPAATHSTFSQATNEVSGGGYARQVLGGQTITETAGTISFKATKVNFGATTTITADSIVLTKRTGTGTNLTGTDFLLGYMILDTTGTGASSSNGKFEVRWGGVDGVGTLFTAQQTA